MIRSGVQRKVVGMLGALSLFAPWQVQAQIDTRVVGQGLSAPVFATAPLGDGRLFVLEKAGAIKVLQHGVASTFLSVAVATSGEQGLLGLAFDPGYANPASSGYRRLFVSYTESGSGDTVIASYLRNSADPSIADPGSRVEIMRIDQPSGLTNHKAGWIGFKPGNANNLYIASGDGGGSNDPLNAAQSRSTLLGKMLRIDINTDAFPADPSRNYAIPIDNPFVGAAGTLPEIYQLGLRNPWRNSFDAATGNLWITDVGQGQREEINFVPGAVGGGQNFGWRIREGDIPTPGINDGPVGGLTSPILVYSHGVGQAIVGGYVVREPGSPLFGQYVFGDFVTGRIWAIPADGMPRTLAQATELTSLLDAGQGGPIANVSSFGQGPNGELYIVDFSNGKVVAVVSEPSKMLMMAIGAMLIGWSLRHSQRARATAPQAA